MNVLVDTFAWVELILGSAKGQRVEEVIGEAESVYTVDTVLAELSRKYLRENIPEKTVRERLQLLQHVSHILHITPELALSAGKAYLELSRKAKDEKLDQPSLFDGIVLGVARSKDAKVVTGDPHFKNLQETLWV